MRLSHEQMDKACDAYNQYGYTIEMEGRVGIAVFDNIFALEKFRQSVFIADRIFADLPTTSTADGYVVIRLGTIH